MKTVILAFAAMMFATLAHAESKTVAEKIAYHEKLAKAHEAVADCLKSGKAEAECDKLMDKYSPKWKHKMKRKYEKMKKDATETE